MITGAANGIGTALARRYARAGHAVAVLDVDVDAADVVAKDLAASGSEAIALGCDVTRAKDCHETIRHVVDKWGRVDLLINNAGITHVGLVAETQTDVFRRVMDVNFFGAVNCTQAALPHLLESRGRVVVMSSVAGFAPLATRAGYAASKHALMGFFGSLRAEHEEDGLGVTLVCPSFVRTGIGSRALAATGDRAISDARTGVRNPMEPEVVAEGIFRGERRGRRVIFVGREARLAWWAWKLVPGVYETLMRRRLVGA
ncbi:MAG: SDR family oxidoreductase [Myxococcota bacterium]